MTVKADARVRLDQLLTRCGYASRREAAAWARAGRVTVHDVILRDASARVDPSAVRVDGEPLEAPGGLLAMMHKPAGVVCSRDLREGPSIYDLLPARWSRRHPPVASVGRLDKETTGLLLITDIGDVIHRWTSPRHAVDKHYEVQFEGVPPPDCVEQFASGNLRLYDEAHPCLPARLTWTGEGRARVILTEGKYHQVRRMFAAVGLTVVGLHRSRFGPYELADLAEGAWRLLSLDEGAWGVDHPCAAGSASGPDSDRTLPSPAGGNTPEAR